MMTLVTLSQHLGLMWVAMEATTLVIAAAHLFQPQPPLARGDLEVPSDLFGRDRPGPAGLLLPGLRLAQGRAGTDAPLRATSSGTAPRLSPPWLHAAFVLLLVGYGTKMGLAPMHTWKPDAYGEAPGAGRGAAGRRRHELRLPGDAARLPDLPRRPARRTLPARLLIVMGLLSMAVAAVFMVRQQRFQADARLLQRRAHGHSRPRRSAIGGLAIYGALLHMINNGLTKGVLFLSAGNIHRAYGSKTTDDVRGALRRVPLSAALFLAGFLAITGSPPFGPFVSEFTIVRQPFSAGNFAGAAACSCCSWRSSSSAWASPCSPSSRASLPADASQRPAYRDGFATVAPVVLFMALVLLLASTSRRRCETLLRDAAATSGG